LGVDRFLQLLKLISQVFLAPHFCRFVVEISTSLKVHISSGDYKKRRFIIDPAHDLLKIVEITF
jgi:hypothetical protein